MQFTAEAYATRTGRPCSALSFQDIASGSLPESLVATGSTYPEQEPERNASEQGSGEFASNNDEELNPISFPTIDMTICSFALHLLDDSSQLWALLSELSWKTTWLIILEPHKKPEVSTSYAFLPSILIPSEPEMLRLSRVGVGHNGTSANGRIVLEHKGRELRSLKTGMNHCFYHSFLTLISLKGTLSYIQKFKYLKIPMSVGYHIPYQGWVIIPGPV